MPDILNSEHEAQELENQAVLSLESLNMLRLKIVEDNYDPTPEEMAAVIQTIRPERAKATAPKEKKARAAVPKVSLDDLL